MDSTNKERYFMVF